MERDGDCQDVTGAEMQNEKEIDGEYLRYTTYYYRHVATPFRDISLLTVTQIH